MPTVLIGDIYRIEGQTFAGGSSIPTGTALTRAALRSEDPDANDFAASTESLFLFDRATNDIRTRPAEEIDFFVDGVLISRETPDLETTALNTNLGRLNGLTFVVDGDTYFLPRNEGPLDGTLDTITAPSSVGSFLPVTGISLLQHGLQIPGSTEYEGQVFGRGAADVAGLGLTRSATDSDDTPLNTGESTERTDFTAEVLVTVTFDDGQTLSNVRAYGDIGFGPFFVGDLSAFAVEVAAIQATGRTLDNVVDADFQSFTSHDLTYAEVGFEAISGVTDMSSLGLMLRTAGANGMLYAIFPQLMTYCCSPMVRKFATLSQEMTTSLLDCKRIAIKLS